MKWKSKVLRAHLAGDERTIIVFAWRPIECNGGHIHWLEKVEIRQFWGEYSHTWRTMNANGLSTRRQCYCPSPEPAERSSA